MILLNIVAIFAHPDDLTFYCDGIVARWADEGHSVIALCCTKGELKKLTKYANRLLRSIAIAVGKNVNLKASEAFFVQKTLPGHFDNFQQLMSEMLGNPPEPPKIY